MHEHKDGTAGEQEATRALIEELAAVIAAGLEMMVEELATDGMAPCVINDALILAAQNAGLHHQAAHHGDTPMGRLAQAALRLTCPDQPPDIVA